MSTTSSICLLLQFSQQQRNPAAKQEFRMTWKWWITAKFCHTAQEILITPHDELVSNMADLVQWCLDKVPQTISIEIWRTYLKPNIISKETKHIPQKPWSFLCFLPENTKHSECSQVVTNQTAFPRDDTTSFFRFIPPRFIGLVHNGRWSDQP